MLEENSDSLASRGRDGGTRGEILVSFNVHAVQGIRT
jgi:hypothetical protein